jgi:DNA-binding transcriptional MerR regulator
MPLGAKFRKLHDLKLKSDGRRYDISEISREASRLYLERQILRRTQELTASGASMKEIAHACEELRGQPDALNRQYLTDLRDGKKRDAPFRVIEALSLFFEVPTDFFRIGDDATEETRAAEAEVELTELAVQLIRNLNNATEGDDAGTELVMSLMRGGVEGDPKQVANVLRLARAAMNTPQEK